MAGQEDLWADAEPVEGDLWADAEEVPSAPAAAPARSPQAGLARMVGVGGPKEGPPVGEAVARGAARSTMLGTWADEAYGAGGAAAYGLAKGVRSLLPGGVPEGAPDVADVYEQLRSKYNEGDEAADPVGFGVGMGGGILAQGGAQLLKSLPAMVKSAPRALEALGTAGGRAAAGAAAGKGAISAGALGAVGGAGAAEPGERLEGAAKGAAVGAGLGAPLAGFAGAAGAGLADDADAARRAAGAARDIDAADAAKVENDLRNQAMKGQFDESLGQHADEVERLKMQHSGDVAQAAAERSALQEAGAAKHAEEVAGVERTNAAAREAAESAARAPTPDKAVRLFGLEQMKDPERAARSAGQLYGEETEGGGRLVDELLASNPERGLELIRGLKQQALGGLKQVREALRASGARVQIGPALGEMRQAVGQLPSALREQALNQIDDLVLAGARDGFMDPGRLRQAIESLDGPAKHGATLASGTQVRETAPIFRMARGKLLELEKSIVPEELKAVYDDSLRKYAVFSDAEIGALRKLKKVQRGQPPVKFDKPAPVDELPTPEAPAGPISAKVAPPVLPPAPKRPAPIPDPARPPNEAELLELIKSRTPEAGRLAKTAVGMAGRVVGGQLGGEAAKMAVDRWLQTLVPSADLLSSQSVKAAERLAKFAPTLARAQSEGPKAVALTHNLLMQRFPEYAEIFGMGQKPSR